MKWIKDRYKVIQKFPGGNLSKVYLSVDYEDDDHNEVVLKVFDYSDSENKEYQTKLFFREIENLENLDHLGIIKLLDKGKDDENKVYYISIEYFESKTLDNLIANVPLSDKQKQYVILQLLDAMVYAHSKQIVHRDLKPTNILINDTNEIKVIDFGTSKIKNSLYSDFTVSNLVTPKYASWEQKAFKNIDQRTDIYSLGIIFFELLSNKIIGEGIDLESTIEGNTVIIPEIKKILINMTKTEPSERISSMVDVRSAFKTIFKQNITGPVYGISFTATAVKNLHQFNYIRNINRTEATQVIYQDLVKNKTYMDININSNKEHQQVYRLYGKQFEFLCVVDNMTESTFTIKSIQFRNIVTHENNKERAILVEVEWDVVPNIQSGVHFDDIYNLIEFVESRKREYSIREKAELREKSSIERWQRVLRLYSQSLEESRNTLTYVGFEKGAFDERIWVELNKSLDNVPFTDEQLLSMTNRSNINKTKGAGYCVDFDGNKLIIQLEKNANPNDFAQSGEISVDQRMIETALHRQKRALKNVQFKELENKTLAEILFDPSTAKSSKAVLDIKYQSDLDESKKDAIEKALSVKDIFLLQGPPGTGKTTFISELVYQINKENPESKILISSQSNVAVDHALNKIKELLPGVPMLRVGRRDKMSLGAERFTIEEQLDDWFDEIKKLCTSFLTEYKQIKGIDDDLVKKYQITHEIKEIGERLKDINDLQVENYNESKIVKEKYDSLKVLTNQMQKNAATIHSRVEQVSEGELLSIINLFKDRMQEVNNNFISQLDLTIGLADKKEYLELEYEELIKKKLVLETKMTALKESISVETSEQLEIYKADIEKILDQKKKDYEQISKLEKIQKEWIDRLGKDDKLTDVMLRRTNIIGATCLGIAGLPSANQMIFDWVIIDEAGRATPPELLVPMTLGRKIVLVGDHKQLPPLIDQHIQKLNLASQNIRVKELEVSLFEELINSINTDCVGTLKEQHRMHPAIGNLVSKVFYEGTLESKTKIADREHGYKRWEQFGVVWLSTADHQERHEHVIKQSHNHKTYLNRLEARTIFETLYLMEKDYLNNGITKEVGIIAGYQAQKSELRKLFETEYKNKFQKLQIEINTVDAFQGRETDIIFYSVVRSNKEGKIGFLADYRRLNVALSRARDLLVIIGDHVSATKEETIYRDQANPFVKVIDFIHSNSQVCKLEGVEKK